MKRYICLFLSMFFSMSLHADNNAQLKIACNLPISRELAIYGSSVREGVDLFRDTLSPEKNALVAWDWQDNESSPRNTLTIARMQLQNKPDIYVSGIKPQYMAIEDLLIKHNIPNIAWIFDPKLRAKNPNNFRFWVNFKDEGLLFLDYMKKQNVKKVSIVHVILPTVEEQQEDIIIPGLKDMGILDLQVIPYQMDVTDFKTIALKVKKHKPDLIFLNGFQHNLIPMIKTLRSYKLITDNNTVSSYDLLDAAHHLSPHELEGIKVTTPEFLLSKDPKILKWKKRFKERFGKEPIYSHAYAYDMAEVIYDVAEKRAASDSQRDITELLYSVDLQGISSRLKFNKHGDHNASIDYGVFRNGKLIQYSDSK